MFDLANSKMLPLFSPFIFFMDSVKLNTPDGSFYYVGLWGEGGYVPEWLRKVSSTMETLHDSSGMHRRSVPLKSSEGRSSNGFISERGGGFLFLFVYCVTVLLSPSSIRSIQTLIPAVD